MKKIISLSSISACCIIGIVILSITYGRDTVLVKAVTKSKSPICTVTYQQDGISLFSINLAKNCGKGVIKKMGDSFTTPKGVKIEIKPTDFIPSIDAFGSLGDTFIKDEKYLNFFKAFNYSENSESDFFVNAHKKHFVTINNFKSQEDAEKVFQELKIILPTYKEIPLKSKDINFGITECGYNVMDSYKAHCINVKTKAGNKIKNIEVKKSYIDNCEGLDGGACYFDKFDDVTQEITWRYSLETPFYYYNNYYATNIQTERTRFIREENKKR